MSLFFHPAGARPLTIRNPFRQNIDPSGQEKVKVPCRQYQPICFRWWTIDTPREANTAQATVEKTAQTLSV
jgi:hypothetical protein